jgi:hypothetical protein
MEGDEHSTELISRRNSQYMCKGVKEVIELI